MFQTTSVIGGGPTKWPAGLEQGLKTGLDHQKGLKSQKTSSKSMVMLKLFGLVSNNDPQSLKRSIHFLVKRAFQ